MCDAHSSADAAGCTQPAAHSALLCVAGVELAPRKLHTNMHRRFHGAGYTQLAAEFDTDNITKICVS